MKDDTRRDRRRTQHVGILGNMWTAHDRGFADNGVRASHRKKEQHGPR